VFYKLFKLKHFELKHKWKRAITYEGSFERVKLTFDLFIVSFSLWHYNELTCRGLRPLSYDGHLHNLACDINLKQQSNN